MPVETSIELKTSRAPFTRGGYHVMIQPVMVE
jgi:hypothetical protein